MSDSSIENITLPSAQGEIVINPPYNDLFPEVNKLRIGKDRFIDVPLRLSVQGKRVEVLEGLTANTYKDKSFTLSLCTILKNDGLLLEGWLEHYLLEGVEHFYIIDLSSTEETYYILNKYRSYITYYKEKEVTEPDKSLCDTYILPHNKESEWIFFAFTNAFFYCSKGSLLQYVNSVPKNVNRIPVHEKHFFYRGEKDPVKECLFYDCDIETIDFSLTRFSSLRSFNENESLPKHREETIKNILYKNLYVSRVIPKKKDTELADKYRPKITYGNRSLIPVILPVNNFKVKITGRYNNLFGDPEEGQYKNLTINTLTGEEIKVKEDTPVTLNTRAFICPKITIVYFINTYKNKNYLLLLHEQLSHIKGELLERSTINIEVCTNEEDVKEKIKKILPKAKINLHRDEHEYGLEKVWKLGQKREGLIFYFHAKGLVNFRGYRGWEKILSTLLIDEWEKNVHILFFLESVSKLGIMARPSGALRANFFWVKTDYLKDKEKPLRGMDKRYYKDWLGKGNFNDVYNKHCAPPLAYNIGSAFLKNKENSFSCSYY